jgi:hypothetical protein
MLMLKACQITSRLRGTASDMQPSPLYDQYMQGKFAPLSDNGKLRVCSEDDIGFLVRLQASLYAVVGYETSQRKN